jgi:hypothetical protein
MKTLLTIVLLASIAVLAACSFSTTLAQSLVALEAGLTAADPGFEAQVSKYFSAAITAAENLKPGTFSADLEEGLADLADNLDLLPTTSKTDQIVAAAVNFIDNEIAILQASKSKASVMTPAALEAWYYAYVSDEGPAPATSATRKHVWHGKQIKTPAQLKSELRKLGVKTK